VPSYPHSPPARPERGDRAELGAVIIVGGFGIQSGNQTDTRGATSSAADTEASVSTDTGSSAAPPTNSPSLRDATYRPSL
jgi:hypothetical protein